MCTLHLLRTRHILRNQHCMSCMPTLKESALTCATALLLAKDRARDVPIQLSLLTSSWTSSQKSSSSLIIILILIMILSYTHMGAGGEEEVVRQAGCSNRVNSQATWWWYKRLNGQASWNWRKEAGGCSLFRGGGEITPKKLEIGEKLEKVQGDYCDEEVKLLKILERSILGGLR